MKTTINKTTQKHKQIQRKAGTYALVVGMQPLKTWTHSECPSQAWGQRAGAEKAERAKAYILNFFPALALLAGWPDTDSFQVSWRVMKRPKNAGTGQVYPLTVEDLGCQSKCHWDRGCSRTWKERGYTTTKARGHRGASELESPHPD